MVGLLVTLAILGFVGFIITRIAMPDNIRQVIVAVVILLAVLVVLHFFFPGSVRIPK